MAIEKAVEEIEIKQPSFLDFEVFQKVFGVKIASIGLECPTCKNFWGFKVYDEKTIADIKQSKLICFNCANNVKNKETEQQPEKAVV